MGKLHPVSLLSIPHIDWQTTVHAVVKSRIRQSAHTHKENKTIFHVDVVSDFCTIFQEEDGFAVHKTMMPRVA